MHNGAVQPRDWIVASRIIHDFGICRPHLPFAVQSELIARGRSDRFVGRARTGPGIDATSG